MHSNVIFGGHMVLFILKYKLINGDGGYSIHLYHEQICHNTEALDKFTAIAFG